LFEIKRNFGILGPFRYRLKVVSSLNAPQKDSHIPTSISALFQEKTYQPAAKIVFWNRRAANGLEMEVRGHRAGAARLWPLHSLFVFATRPAGMHFTLFEAFGLDTLDAAPQLIRFSGSTLHASQCR
jgi:hypothetical protein